MFYVCKLRKDAVTIIPPYINLVKLTSCAELECSAFSFIFLISINVSLKF